MVFLGLSRFSSSRRRLYWWERASYGLASLASAWIASRPQKPSTNCKRTQTSPTRGDSMASSAQLERKAERARERLSDRIADLRYHVSPGTVVSDIFGVDPRALESGILPLLAKQARNNPIASLLIGAGIGWLIFSEVRGPLSEMAF